MIQMYLQNRKRLTDLENEFMVAGEVGEGVVREVGMGMDTLLCLTWMSSEDALCSPRRSAEWCVAAG